VTKYTQQQLADFPWIVSCDTLRPEDLLPKFWSVAEGLAVWLDRPKMIDASTLVSLAKLVGEDSKAEDWNDSEAAQTMGDLFDVLGEAAPVGFGFGASEGDGACFGFWLSEEWAEALETLGFGNDDPTGWASLIEELEADGIEADGIEDAYQGRAEGISEERAGAAYAQQLAEDVGEIDWAQAPVAAYLHRLDGRLARARASRRLPAARPRRWRLACFSRSLNRFSSPIKPHLPQCQTYLQNYSAASTPLDGCQGRWLIDNRKTDGDYSYAFPVSR
jgi:hypothetical protein